MLLHCTTITTIVVCTLLVFCVCVVWTVCESQMRERAERVRDCCNCCLIACEGLDVERHWCFLWVCCASSPNSLVNPAVKHWRTLIKKRRMTRLWFVPRIFTTLSFLSCKSRWLSAHKKNAHIHLLHKATCSHNHIYSCSAGHTLPQHRHQTFRSVCLPTHRHSDAGWKAADTMQQIDRAPPGLCQC